MVFETIGGKSGDYQPKVHSVRPFSPIMTPNAVIKLYSMRSVPQKPFSLEVMSDVKDLVTERLRDGRINPRLGLGFAVVSNGFINVSVWGGEYPSLLNNNLFGFDKPENMRKSIQTLDIREFGTYCVWELGVAAHEGAAWREYLWTQGTEQDKMNYINNTLDGQIK